MTLPRGKRLESAAVQDVSMVPALEAVLTKLQGTEIVSLD